MKEIADKVSEKNKNNEFSEPFTNSAEQGIISQKDYFDREIVNNENLDGYYIVRMMTSFIIQEFLQRLLLDR